MKLWRIRAFIEKARPGVSSSGTAVDSAVLKVSNISKDFFKKNKIEEDFFFEVLKKGFAQKRKMLASNLSGIAPKAKISEILQKMGKKDARAEELAPRDWADICKALK